MNAVLLFFAFLLLATGLFAFPGQWLPMAYLGPVTEGFTHTSTNGFMSPVTVASPSAAFTPGNLVVYRVGTGIGSLGAATAAVFLDEYTPAGTLVQSIALPTEVSGQNRILTAVGSSTSEGYLTRSTNGGYLVLTGYNAAPGAMGAASSSSATTNRVVARVDAAGNVDTSTALTDALSSGTVRGAASTDGNDIWISGTSSGGGIRHTTFGSTTSTALNTATVTNLRATAIYDGQLYVSAQSGEFRLASVGAGIPTTAGQPITNLPGIPTENGNPYGFVFADLSPDVPGADTVYLAEDSTVGNGGGAKKYSLVGGVWTLTGTIGLSVTRGLTGSVSGSTVVLYATANGTSLNTATDTSGYNAVPNGTFTQIATSGTNRAFRGVAFAPVTLDITPPTITDIDDGDPDDSVTVGTLLTYTITFGEDIDEATVSAADFTNAGTSSATFGTVSETAPGVVTVQVTPTSVGTFRLALQSGTLIKDLAGNDLVLPVEDDTTLTVLAPTVPGQLSWTSSQYGANEGDGTVTLTVQRTGGTEGAVTVEYALTSNSATGGADCSFAGVDFVKTFGTLSFANGETSKAISATICNDSVLEGNEGFVATLSAPTGGATLISPSVALVFIEDNEPRTFVVDVILDDAGYEFCEPNTPADCSLRGALGSVRDGDSITFDPALFNSASLAPAAMQTITLGSELVLNANMTITGPGASLLTIDGGPGANRIFNIAAGKNVTMSKMTLTGGNISGFGNHGGAILVNDGSTLDLASMTITGNTAYRGAGIYSRNSAVTIANSTISGNIATNVGGGISTIAETYNSHGSVSITNSVISGNRAYEGGGISAEGPTTITNSTISANVAFENGGGIWADQGYSIGAVWLRVTGSTISGNSAAISGGGVYLSTGNPTLLPERPVSALTNSTFTANSAGSGYGSALRVSSQFAAVEVSSNTFAGNPASSVSPSTIYSTVPSGWLPVVLRNTIVSGSGCSGPINNGGFNIDSGTSCGFGTANSSMSSTDPLLGPLQDNGGPTLTMAILPNSPAIDAGSAFCPSVCLTTDQRGLTRPIDHASVPNADDGSDIGAFEIQAVSAASASISGRVLTTHGRGVSGVVITVQGTNGVSKTAVTNTLGYYKFNDLQTGELFVVTAKSKRYTFEQPVQVVNLGDSIAGLNFRASI